MTNTFLRQLVKNIQDENTSIAEEGTASAEFDGYIDTGAYMLNGQICGSLRGGHPNNKVLTFAGEQSVGKTFLALSVVKHFLSQHADGICIWYLAEPAVTRKMLEDRNMDPARVAFAEPDTVQEWTHHLIEVLKNYMEQSKRPPLIVVLDSLGALSTTKELTDALKGDEKEDLTKPKKVKRAFRILDKMLAKSKVPLIVTNHTYQGISANPMYAVKEMSGGSGLKYAGDAICFLSAKKDKEGEGINTVVNGTIVKVTMWKNRFAKQWTKTELLLSFETGLDRYYGLMELGLKYNIIQKKRAGAKGNLYVLPDGRELKLNEFTPAVWEELLDVLEVAANQEFEYGKVANADNDSDTEPTDPQ